MSKTPVPEQCEILPQDIDPYRFVIAPMASTRDLNLVLSASVIMMLFFRPRNTGWEPFALNDLLVSFPYIGQRWWRIDMAENVIEDLQQYVFDNNGTYSMTKEFVDMCHKASGAVKAA